MAIDDTLPTLDKYATLMIPGKDPIKLPILKGTLGPEVIDIRELGKQGYFTTHSYQHSLVLSHIYRLITEV